MHRKILVAKYILLGRLGSPLSNF